MYTLMYVYKYLYKYKYICIDIWKYVNIVELTFKVAKSRWLLGSSNNKRLWGIRTKLAKATLAFSPPERCPTLKFHEYTSYIWDMSKMKDMSYMERM
jgi:hypothetical protein